MTKFERPAALSRRALLRSGGALVVSIGMPISIDAVLAVSEAEIKQALEGLKCRCGTHMGILRAVKRAAETMAG